MADNGEVVDLPRWVQLIAREEWTKEVFDLELMSYKDIEGEMVGLLDIAILCTSDAPDQRPMMDNVVKMIHEIEGIETSLRRDVVDVVSDSPSYVEWGKVNMIEAERRLLANALLDVSNQRFVLLSESCIPLFNFSTVYSYLTNSKHSFVESYDLAGPVGRGRYSPKMAPTVHINDWRKGSQWFEMDRDLAIEVIADKEYFSVFHDFCDGQCYADEHYLPTFVTKKFGETNSNRTLHFVDWARGGPHPTRYYRNDVTEEFLVKLRSDRRCEYNGMKNQVCHLFARKFTFHSLDRLLRIAPKLMQFNH
uniref:Glycosyl transferase, family 14 n=1 Tax=Tanacetum cinerariifolium TaxID=118510 RepID=A0A6L2P7M6_TANCI|nr:glycosyl transferase, family 14 [Tanacetum cinerariifolium]